MPDDRDKPEQHYHEVEVVWVGGSLGGGMDFESRCHSCGHVFKRIGVIASGEKAIELVYSTLWELQILAQRDSRG